MWFYGRGEFLSQEWQNVRIVRMQSLIRATYDTRGEWETDLSCVYTIQAVVQPVVKTVV